MYPPVRGATGDLLEELTRHLTSRGWSVEIVTGPAPGEPMVATHGRVSVYRSRGAAPGVKSARMGVRGRRLLTLLPSLYALARQRARTRPDVLLTLSDPPLGFLAGPRLGRIARAPVVHWSHDVYPDVAVRLGVLEGGPVASVLRRAASRALRRHDAVVAIGRDMADLLQAQGAAASRLEVVPNWPLDGVAPDLEGARQFRRRHDLEGRFVAMHAGSVGLAHPFEAILEAAGRLAGRVPHAVVLFVGDGTRRAALEAEAQLQGLENVRFLPLQPREALAATLSAADVHLVSMADALEGVLAPSKVYGTMAVARPTVFVGPPTGEIGRLVLEAEAGRVVPHDGRALADALEAYARAPALANADGARGRRAVQDARSRSLGALEDVLTRAADRPISGAL